MKRIISTSGSRPNQYLTAAAVSIVLLGSACGAAATVPAASPAASSEASASQAAVASSSVSASASASVKPQASAPPAVQLPAHGDLLYELKFGASGSNLSPFTNNRSLDAVRPLDDAIEFLASPKGNA